MTELDIDVALQDIGNFRTIMMIISRSILAFDNHKIIMGYILPAKMAEPILLEFNSAYDILPA